jgi:hypothetical protein
VLRLAHEVAGGALRRADADPRGLLGRAGRGRREPAAVSRSGRGGGGGAS